MKNNGMTMVILMLVLVAILYRSFFAKIPATSLPHRDEPIGVSVYGVDRGHGNLLAVQPWMRPMDYAHEEAFYNAFDRSFVEAQRQGLLQDKTIVVFPEYIGTWLVATGEGRPVYTARTMKGAMIALMLSHPLRFGKTVFSSSKSAKDPVKYSLFKMKSRQMAEVYNSVFSRLARDYCVTIVAGSIILPNPTIKDGRLVIGDGPLQNVTAIYRPDGQADGLLTKKIHLTTDEQEFASGAPTEGPRVYETPAGKLGVMVCADSWFPEAYQNLKNGDAQFVIAPSFFSPDGFSRPWPGYNGSPNPADVDPNDLGRLTEQEAWNKYALPGRIAASGARFGMIPYFRGTIWDIASNGYVLIVDDGRIAKIKNESQSAIVNFWLP